MQQVSDKMLPLAEAVRTQVGSGDEDWIDRNIRAVPDFGAYIRGIDPERLRRLEAEASTHHG